MMRTDTDQAQDVLLDFYTHPGPLTAISRHAPLAQALPHDVAGLVRVVQGLLIHEFMASDYGVTVTEERKAESHIRPVDEMLDSLLALEPGPLDIARQPGQRL